MTDFKITDQVPRKMTVCILKMTKLLQHLKFREEFNRPWEQAKRAELARPVPASASITELGLGQGDLSKQTALFSKNLHTV